MIRPRARVGMGSSSHVSSDEKKRGVGASSLDSRRSCSVRPADQYMRLREGCHASVVTRCHAGVFESRLGGTD